MATATDWEEAVLTSIRDDKLLSENENKAFDKEVMWAERVLGQASAFVGSWKFNILLNR